MALYYLKPGQTDYSEAQKVYAKVTAPGVYTFDLDGQWVTGLRIDPDSVGGVPTLFTGIDLNPRAHGTPALSRRQAGGWCWRLCRQWRRR